MSTEAGELLRNGGRSPDVLGFVVNAVGARDGTLFPLRARPEPREREHGDQDHKRDPRCGTASGPTLDLSRFGKFVGSTAREAHVDVGQV